MRYFIGFLITVGLIILLIVLLFNGGGSKAPVVPRTLSSFATTDAQVRLTIDGTVSSPQTHQQIQITVDRDTATYEQLQGYDGSVVNQQSYANTESSYIVFLKALNVAGFAQSVNPKLTDERGYCPLGQRFIFELMQDGKDIKRSWATSCGSPKTYAGNVPLTMSLFDLQIPDYSMLSQNVNLNL